MERIRAAFADEGDAIGNPLDPLTPMRLAYLVREAVPEDSRASHADVFTALWDRRAQLARQVAASLADYRDALRAFAKRRGICRPIRGVGRLIVSFSLMAALGLLVYAAATHDLLVMGHEHLVGTVDVIRNLLGACVFGVILGFLAIAGARGRMNTAEGVYIEAYREFLQRLIPELGDMARQVIQLRDEQASGILQAPMNAPSLVESGSPAVVQSASFLEVLGLVEGHVSSAVGIVGSRGAGKSTLLRLLCGTSRPAPGHLSSLGQYIARPGRPGRPGLPANLALPRIGVFLTAPADPAAGDFVKVIYATTVRKVLASQNVFAGVPRGWRQRIRVQPQDHIALAQQALERITGSLSLSSSRNVGVSEYGVSASLGKQRTWTERELSHADWVAEFRDYLERHHLRGGAPILIAIDELDKISDAARAAEIINGLKDLFHVDGVHFVISVSDDALRSFATRGIPVRDIFDSAFDTIVEIPPMTASESCELLRARVRYFPYSAALFCHAWSGGLPRELIRTARSCVAILNDAGEPVPVADLAQRIIRRDLLHFADAAIRLDNADIALLLKLRHSLIDGSALPQSFVAHGRTAPASDGVTGSLGPYLAIASAIADYFAIQRSAVAWTDGLQTGALLTGADLLAQARAGLAVHPAEAEWRLRRARESGTDEEHDQ